MNRFTGEEVMTLNFNGLVRIIRGGGEVKGTSVK